MVAVANAKQVVGVEQPKNGSSHDTTKQAKCWIALNAIRGSVWREDATGEERDQKVLRITDFF